MDSSWQVTEREHGLQLLEALTLRIPTAPRGFLKQCCRKGRLRRNGRVLEATTRIEAYDRLEVAISERMSEILSTAPLLPWQLLFEDGSTMVIAKPSGLLTHPAESDRDSLSEKVRDFVRARGENYRVAPVHRLDRGTSGPVLFGKGSRAIGSLGRLFMAGRMEKRYLALVTGRPPRFAELLSPVTAHGKLKSARSRFRRLDRKGEMALLELQLLTGRTHQLRRQLAEAGWPILGDRRYRGRSWPGLEHPFLHGCSLDFPSLKNDGICRIRCPLPADLSALIAETGLSVAGLNPASADIAGKISDGEPGEQV